MRSPRKIAENTIIAIGPADPIIGALMDSVILRAKKKNMIFMVTPKSEYKIIPLRFSFIFFEFFKSLYTKGKSIKVAIPKRKNARVNGGMFCRENLNIGEAAPQMIFAIINARIAF